MAKKSVQVPLYEQVLKELKGKIVSGIYKKGDLLPSEKELIDEFGVSRITVRKTLSLLAEMGLIETSKGRGSVVLFSYENISTNHEFAEAVEEYYKSFMMVLQIRLLLEPEAARQVAKIITKEQAEELKKTAKIGHGQSEDNDFHRAMIAVLNNQKLSEIMEELIVFEESKAPLGIIQPEKQEKIGKILEEQHLKIIGAIEEGDEEFAYFYMKEHTNYIAHIYEEYFKILKN